MASGRRVAVSIRSLVERTENDRIVKRVYAGEWVGRGRDGLIP